MHDIMVYQVPFHLFCGLIAVEADRPILWLWKLPHGWYVAQAPQQLKPVAESQRDTFQWGCKCLPSAMDILG